MNIKRNIAGLALASLFSFSMAGTLTVDASRSFARELIDCTSGNTNDFTFNPIFTYDLGVGVSAGTEFLVRYDLPSGATFVTAFADGDVTLSDMVANAAASITIRSGGGATDTFVEYRIILGGAGGNELDNTDSIILDMSAGMVVQGDNTALKSDSDSYTMTATLTDDFGVFDTSGDHDAIFGNSAYALSGTIDNAGAATIDVGDDRQTFEGGATVDSSGAVNLGIDTSLAALDGSTISGLENLGELDVTVAGDDTGVTDVNFPDLNGGGVSLTAGTDSFTDTLVDGSTDVASGAVIFTVDGTTALDARTFTVGVGFTADLGVANDRTIISTGTITVWGLNGTVLSTGFYKIGSTVNASDFTSVILLTNHSAASGSVTFKVYSIVSSGTGTFEQASQFTLDANGVICSGTLPFDLGGNSTMRVGHGTLTTACGVDFISGINTAKEALFVVFTIESNNVSGLNLFSTNGVFSAVALANSGGL